MNPFIYVGMSCILFGLLGLFGLLFYTSIKSYRGEIQLSRWSEGSVLFCVIACVVVVACLLYPGSVLGDEIVQETRWTVQTADGQTISQHDQQHVAIRRALELSRETGETYYVAGNRLRVKADQPDPVDPPVVDPDPTDPPVVDPPTISEGFLARAPKADAIRVPEGGDIQAALDTGRDVLLQAGATYQAQDLRMTRDGQLLGVYGTGDRAIIEGDDQTILRPEADNLTITGLHLTYPHRNPDSPRWDAARATADEREAISVVYGCSNLLIEDCKIDYAGKGISLQDRDDSRVSTMVGVRIHRNILRYNWNRGDRGAGIFTYRAREVSITECLIDHNGWHPKISGRDGQLHDRGTMAHGIYQTGKYGSGEDANKGEDYVFEFHGNIVSRSSATGAQFRLGANVTDNVFFRNPMGFYVWTNESSAHRNTLLEGTDIDDDPPLRRGWGMQIISGGMYTNNVIANERSDNGGSHAVVYEHPGAVVTGNTFYNWQGPNRDSPVWNKNDYDLTDRVFGNRTETGDITASLTAKQLDRLAERERDVWDDEHSGKWQSEQLREAYE